VRLFCVVGHCHRLDFTCREQAEAIQLTIEYDRIRHSMALRMCFAGQQSARSIPAETPAAVIILPECTMRSSRWGFAPMILGTPILYQCVVAGELFKIPAALKINAAGTDIERRMEYSTNRLPKSGPCTGFAALANSGAASCSIIC
jgi:hypothetical protein